MSGHVLKLKVIDYLLQARQNSLLSLDKIQTKKSGKGHFHWGLFPCCCSSVLKLIKTQPLPLYAFQPASQFARQPMMSTHPHTEWTQHLVSLMASITSDADWRGKNTKQQTIRSSQPKLPFLYQKLLSAGERLSLACLRVHWFWTRNRESSIESKTGLISRSYLSALFHYHQLCGKQTVFSPGLRWQCNIVN